MTQTYPRIPVSELKQFMKDMFIGIGVPEDEAEICSKILIKSDLRGIESHGIGRLKMYYDRMVSGQQGPGNRHRCCRLWRRSYFT